MGSDMDAAWRGDRTIDRGGLTLKNLRTFFWLSRHRNYHAVARQLNVTQPAVSSRISALEEELGVRLFFRDRQSVELTPEGHEALRLAEAVLERADHLAVRFTGAGRPSGFVRIGVVETVARTWLPALLNRVRQQYPGIRIEITTESTVTLHGLLRSAALAMSVSVAPCRGRDIGNREVCRYEMAWVARPGVYDADRLYSRRDLLDLPLIDYLPGSPPAVWLAGYFGEELRRRGINNTTNSMSTMIGLAESGLGVAAIPPQAIPQYLGDGRLGLVRTEVPLETMPFHLNFRTRPLSPVVEAVKALVIEAAR